MKGACGVCGAAVRAPFQVPAPELAPDLDFRPGEPTRSTLGRWVATCRGCGASAPDLAELPRQAREVVDSAEYRGISGAGAAFLRYALLCDAGERADVILQAAWALDDAGEDASALRRRAAGLFGDTLQHRLRALDALRRAGEMAAAGALAAQLLRRGNLEETDRLLLAYQAGLIESGDTGRHLLSSALRPPAHRPHVTHGRGERRSIWQRLAGR